ncbi:hypothetical protein AB2S22_28325, partial [Pseudomonas putida]|uniref:hypothetical protein n=1 Tax=Pseudomonas putida TaxID=303 RepID=UPI00346267DC
MPVAFARERLGARLDIASYKQGGRAGLAQAILARNKCRSGFTREAPRGRRSISQALNLLSRNLAALDLLAHASISRRTNKAVARVWHRRYWPE